MVVALGCCFIVLLLPVLVIRDCPHPRCIIIIIILLMLLWSLGYAVVSHRVLWLIVVVLMLGWGSLISTRGILWWDALLDGLVVIKAV